MLHFRDLSVEGLRVLIREDLNVPVLHGEVTSDLRIRAALPTLEYAVSAGARVMRSEERRVGKGVRSRWSPAH
mgnify:CR=1 FL=1